MKQIAFRHLCLIFVALLSIFKTHNILVTTCTFLVDSLLQDICQFSDQPKFV